MSPEQGKRASHPADGTVIAIIEDQDAIADLIADILDGAGFRPVRIAAPYPPAAIAGHGADLVMLDVLLGRIMGWDVLAAIREHPATSALPVLIMSALYDRAGLHPLPAGGATGFMPKPFDIEQLVAAVTDLLGQVRSGA